MTMSHFLKLYVLYKKRIETRNLKIKQQQALIISKQF